MIKYLVTSGCSFSDNRDYRWPHFLAHKAKLKLFNRAHGSSGNDWISKTIVYQTQELLDAGVDPSEIVVGIMWSGIDRKSIFLSQKENLMYANLINFISDHSNPVNFLDGRANTTDTHNTVDGYLVGSMGCVFSNPKINNFKSEVVSKFFCNEALAIESYENFLRIQWFCESKGIKYFMQTYMDIMHYPHYNPNTLSTQHYYRNIMPLYKMIDFSKWVFWDETGGLFEYAKDNDLGFYSDKLHPDVQAQEYYVDNYLLPKLKEKGIL